ncbi:MAG: DUF932 domain-containing protein [Dehalococcoidia bacterium]
MIDSIAYSNATPWHKLGTRMPGTMNVETALTAAQLRWTVRLDPVYLRNSDGTAGAQVPDRSAVIREDRNKIIGNVGPLFAPIQNHDAFGVLSDVCRDHGVTIEVAGALDEGRRTWMLAKMPDDQTITPIAGDDVRGYFLIHNGHDGSLAYGGRCTPIRVVCQNTLTAALGSRHNADVVRIRHTSNAGARLDEAARLIKTMIQAMKQTGETFSDMARQAMTPEQIRQYIERVIPHPDPKQPSDAITKRRKIIASLVFAGNGAELANADMPQGYASVWGAYNAVTEYWDHVRPAETKSRSAERSAYESLVFGSAQTAKAKALDVARELVTV